jgi:hypothetical protein
LHRHSKEQPFLVPAAVVETKASFALLLLD